MNFVVCFFVLTSLFVVNCSRTVPNVNQQRLAPSVSDVLRWLPGDTETVIVTSGPFRIADNRAAGSRDIVGLFQALSVGPISILQEGRFTRQLGERTVLVSIAAARRFRAPKTLGPIMYEGGHLIIFDDDPSGLYGVISTSIEAHASAIKAIRGHKVMIFEESWESDLWKIYITFLPGNALLCATDEGFLSETLDRMDSGAERVALPEALPEWKHVSKNAKVWAVRHYVKTGSENDPTSPLSGHDAPYSIADSGAIGLTMNFDADHAEKIEVKYLSSNANAVAVVRQYWERDDISKPLIRTRIAGVVEVLAGRGSRSFALLLRGALGYGIYI